MRYCNVLRLKRFQQRLGTFRACTMSETLSSERVATCRLGIRIRSDNRVVNLLSLASFQPQNGSFVGSWRHLQDVLLCHLEVAAPIPRLRHHSNHHRWPDPAAVLHRPGSKTTRASQSTVMPLMSFFCFFDSLSLI